MPTLQYPNTFPQQKLITRRLLVLCCLLPGLLLGCGRPADSPHKRPKGYTVGVSLASLDGPWRMRMKADIEAAAAKHPDLRLTIVDAAGDAAKQRAQLDKFRADRADAAIVSPVNAQAVTQPVAGLFDAGAAVVVLDRAPIGDRYSCFIAADPKQIGALAGEWLAARLQGKGKIVELRGPVDSLWNEELHAAWRAALRNPGYRFVFDAHVDPPRVDAAKLMGEALERVEQIDAVFAYDDAAAQAAYEVAKTAGREKGTLFIGVGGLSALGILDATFLHPTGGTEAVEAVVKLLRGQKVPKAIVPATRAIAKKHVPSK